MAATKLVKKLISSMIKKKKKGKSYSDQVKPKSKAAAKAGEKVYDQPIRIRKSTKMAKSEGTIAGGTRVTQEKAPSKKTKAKSMGTAAKKAAGKKALKSIPKKAKSSKPQIAMSMKTARKKQMRDTAISKMSDKKNAAGVSERMKRAFQDIPLERRRRLQVIISSGNQSRISKAFENLDLTKSEFIRVNKQFTGG
tara:strand:- start:1030 stop:1614 length:585 start_codon:yes stop_codon:yes gene_type:complete